MLKRLSEHVMGRRAAGVAVLALTLVMVAVPAVVAAQQPETAGEHRPGGAVNIQLPDLNQGAFLGMTEQVIVMSGLVVCVLGLLFGAWTYTAVKNIPVHRAMADISDLIYET